VTAPTYADLLPGRRLLPKAYISQPTEPTQPALTGQVLAAALTARSARCEAMGEVRADLDAATTDCTVPEIGATSRGGRHRADDHTRTTVPAGWSPLPPWERQTLAPTWWATRVLPGQDGMTGRLPAVEVTR
jgi:hypothetical protein